MRVTSRRSPFLQAHVSRLDEHPRILAVKTQIRRFIEVVVRLNRSSRTAFRTGWSSGGLGFQVCLEHPRMSLELPSAQRCAIPHMVTPMRFADSAGGKLVLRTPASEDSFEEATIPFGYALKGSYTSPGPCVPLAAHATVGPGRDVERCRRAVNYGAWGKISTDWSSHGTPVVNRAIVSKACVRI